MSQYQCVTCQTLDSNNHFRSGISIGTAFLEPVESLQRIKLKLITLPMEGDGFLLLCFIVRVLLVSKLRKREKKEKRKTDKMATMITTTTITTSENTFRSGVAAKKKKEKRKRGK